MNSLASTTHDAALTAENFIIQWLALKLSDDKYCDVTYGGLHGWRANGVHNFDIVKGEGRDVISNSIEDSVDVQQEEQGVQNAALANTARH